MSSFLPSGVGCSSHNVTLHYITFDNVTLHVIALPCTEIVELYQTFPGAFYGGGGKKRSSNVRFINLNSCQTLYWQKFMTWSLKNLRSHLNHCLCERCSEKNIQQHLKTMFGCKKSIPRMQFIIRDFFRSFCEGDYEKDQIVYGTTKIQLNDTL